MQIGARKRFLSDNSLSDFPKYIAGYTKKGNKFGGQASRCQYGGLYETSFGGKKYTVLFKQGRNDGETICEFLSTFIYNLIIPGYSAKVFFSKAGSYTQSKQHKNGFHDQVYVGTVFFQDFMEVHKIMGFKDRPLFLQMLHSNKSSHFVQRFQLTNLGRVLAAALWVGDYDVHIANLGLGTVDGQTQFVKIDHGWSFAHFQDRMSLKSVPWSGFSAIGKPTNHFKDYDHNGFYSSANGEFQKALKSMKHIGPEKIKSELERAFKEIEFFYSKEVNISLAKWVGYPKGMTATKDSLIHYLTLKLYKRATSPLM